MYSLLKLLPLLLLETGIAGILVEGCEEVDYCTGCISELLSNETDNVIIGLGQDFESNDPCAYSDYDDASTACIFTSSSVTQNSTIINVKFQPFFLAFSILPILQNAMVEYAADFNEPFCGVLGLSVIANEILAPSYQENVCYTDIIEHEMMIIANSSLPVEDLAGPGGAFETTSQSMEYVYLWNQSRYLRQVTQTTCVICSTDLTLLPQDDVDVVHAGNSTYLVQLIDGVGIEYPYFVELDNGSYITCMTPGITGQPLSSNIPSAVTTTLVVISLISLIITFTTYCVFSELKKNLPGKIIINFVVALFVALLSVLFDLFLPDYDTPCAVAGVVFHYFWLAAFVWMNALSINTTITITSVTPPSKRPTGINKKLLKYMMYGWGSPAIVVIISLILHFCNCTGNVEIAYGLVVEGEKSASCWIGGDDIAGILLFTAIVGILLCINVVLFIYTLYTIRKVTKGIRSHQTRDNKSSRREYSIFIKLSILMGLPWILQLPAEASSSLVLEYIHVIMNALQGFFVFIVLVVTSRARQMWRTEMHKMATSSTPTDSRTTSL